MKVYLYISMILFQILYLGSSVAYGEQVNLISLITPLTHFRLTSSFGPRKHPLRSRQIHHDGLDMAAPRGTPIYAALGGQVVFTGRYGSYGKLLVISHPDGRTAHYAHCEAFYVSVGEKVGQGARIASVGSTGAVTGPHLHFELREGGKPLDPSAVLFRQFTQKNSPLQ